MAPQGTPETSHRTYETLMKNPLPYPMNGSVAWYLLSKSMKPSFGTVWEPWHWALQIFFTPIQPPTSSFLCHFPSTALSWNYCILLYAGKWLYVSYEILSIGQNIHSTEHLYSTSSCLTSDLYIIYFSLSLSLLQKDHLHCVRLLARVRLFTDWSISS